jgi:zinc transport system ATP-binding protein
MSEDLVTVRDLTVELGGNRILHHLNTHVHRGRVTALIGLNGSGKTTLLRAILKEIPFTGKIAFHCGHDHHGITPEHVGYVPQKLRLEAQLPLTVRDLMALALQRRPLFLGVSRHAEQTMGQLLDLVGAPRALLAKPVSEISGGELQRVLLGLALQPHPELLLLDEPAAGIDFKDQPKFYHLIRQLNRERKVTVLMVSHDISVVSSSADHVLCMKDGKIHCEGTPREVATREKLIEIFGAEKALYAHHHASE